MMLVEVREDRARGQAIRAATVLIVLRFFRWYTANNFNDVLVVHFLPAFPADRPAGGSGSFTLRAER